MKTITICLLAVFFFGNAYGQVFQLEREYAAEVNGKYLEQAYSGGNYRSWPRQTFVDIDADGDLDLFVGWDYGYISFYRNTGTAQEPLWTLESERYADIDVGLMAGPTFGDLDADGDQDLLVGNGSSACGGGTVWYYENTGTPQEAGWALVTDTLAALDQCDHAKPALVDIDNDQDLDLFVGGGYGDIAFVRNLGTPWVAVWDSVQYDYAGIDVAWKATPVFIDEDGDGDQDLFVGDDQGELHFYRNTGTPEQEAWEKVTEHYAGVAYEWLNYTAPSFGDLDADGDSDLLVSEHYGAINFYRNNTIGGETTWDRETSNFTGEEFDVGQYSSVTFADIDNDGDADLFMGKRNGDIRFVSNTGREDLTSWTLETEAFGGIDVGNDTRVFLVDIDADGDLDLFAGNEAGKIVQYRQDGAGWTLVSDPVLDAVDVFYNSDPALVDIDADGDLDLFIGGSSKDLAFVRNVGTTREPAWQFVTGKFDSIDVPNDASPVFADTDRDGDIDLIVGSRNGELWMFENVGSATAPSFTFITDYWMNIHPDQNATPALVDVEGDGDLDLFIGGQDGGLIFYRNQAPLPPRDFEISLTPINPPIIIPPAGGRFRYDLDIINNTSEEQRADLWTIINGPDGFKRTRSPVTRTFDPGVLFSRTMRQNVPGRAQAGTYTLTACVGTFPLEDTCDSFTWDKVEGKGHIAQQVSDWGPSLEAQLSDVDGTAVSTEHETEAALPGGFLLTQNYPNPFNPRSSFSMVLEKTQYVSIVLYNLQGKEVQWIHAGVLEAGRTYPFTIDGAGLPNGVYLYRATGETFVAVHQAVLLK